MNTVPFGRTEFTVSRIALGSMQFGWTADEPASFAIMDAYVEAGGNLIDSADIYSRWVKGNWGGDAERIIGRWMAERGNRDNVIIATKCRGPMWKGKDGQGLSRSHIIRACESSLKRLQTDRIDLYQFHWYDDEVPLEESLRAVEELVTAGKVRYLGVSNYPPDRLRAILDAGDAIGLPIVSLQPHHNLVHRKEYETDLQPICLERNVAVIPYSPLAKGFLTGKYEKAGPAVQTSRLGGVKEYFTDPGWQAIAAVRTIAAAHDTTCAAVAIAWQLAQPGIIASITGANSPAQLADQLPGATLDLTPEDLSTLSTASHYYREKGDIHPGR